MKNKSNDQLNTFFKSLNENIPEPDENFRNRLSNTIPNKNHQFIKNKFFKMSVGFAAIVILVYSILPLKPKDEFKPTKTIIIEDKINPDYFKPTKVVTITAADQIK